jgi:hypothetical protein
LIVVPPDEFASDVETMKLMIDFNRGIVMAVHAFGRLRCWIKGL